MLAPPFRKALQEPRARALLGMLAEADEAIRYSDLRRRMEEAGVVDHPQQFQRALDQLMNAGMAQSRVLPKRQRPTGDQRRVVLLEASMLGKVLWRYENLKEDALRQAAKEFGVGLEQLQVPV